MRIALHKNRKDKRLYGYVYFVWHFWEPIRPIHVEEVFLEGSSSSRWRTCWNGP